jgi:hypothetical protein
MKTTGAACSWAIAFDGERRVYASEGESGRVRLIDLESGKKVRDFDLNRDGFQDSFTADLALDRERGFLYVVDQANFRLAVVNVKDGKTVASIRTGRLPFAVAYDAGRREAYVTNIGLFEYKVIPGADPNRPERRVWRFPRSDSRRRKRRRACAAQRRLGMVNVPALGDPNAAESNSVAIVSLENPAKPVVRGGSGRDCRWGG